MSTQQDIYAVGSENRPPMLNKDNYVLWSSRIIQYARSRPNGKMIVDSIENGPYVRRMIATPGEPDLPVPVPESFHEQTDEELTENDIKWMDAYDQAIQTILLGLPEDAYAAVDSCETAKEIWEHVRQMMKGSVIGEQEKKANISTDGESIESYYHHFMQLMNDFKRNKHFPENIAANLKFLNNLQPEWKRHDEVNKLRAERIAKTHDPLALMAHSQNSYNFPATHKDQSSFSTHSQQSSPINNKTSSNPRNRQIAQPGMNMSQDRQIQNVGGNGGNQFGQYAGQVAQNQQGYNAWQNGGIQVAQNAVQNAGAQNGGNQNRLVVVPWIANHNGTGNIVAARAEGFGNRNQARCYNCRGLGHIARNCTARPRRRDAAYLQTQLLIAQKKEAGIQLQAEEFDFTAAAGDLNDIKEVNANCILMENLQHASTSGTQPDKAPVYDTDGSAEVQLNDNCYDNKIFNMFTQEEQYTDLLEPISEPQLVPQNDNHVTSIALSMVQSGGTVETSSAPTEETRAHQETVYRNLVDQVAQEDRFLDKEVDLEAKIKDLKNILLKRDQTVQTMHMLNPKPNSFYHQDQEMALGYPNPLYIKKAQFKQYSLYNGNMLLEEHDPPAVYDSKETLELAQDQVYSRLNSLAKEADESLDKQKYLELEIERLLKASVRHDIMSIVQNGFVDVSSDLRTELDQCKYDKISYDKAYNDMQQKVERLQAQLRDLKDHLQESVDSITSNRAHTKLHNLIYENAKLRAHLFENTSESINNTSRTSVTPHVDKPKLIAITPHSKKLHASIPSHSVPQPREFNVVKHRNVIAPKMFKIDPSQTFRVDLVPNKQSSASIRTNPITNFYCHVTFKENVSSGTVNASFTGLVHTARTRRPQPKGITRNARVPSAFKSSEVKKNVTVEDHRRILLLSKNQKTMSSKCNNIKLAIRNDKSKIVCGTCKRCLVTANHDACLLSPVNALNSRENNLCAPLVQIRRDTGHRLFQAYDREHQASHQLCVEVLRTVRFGNVHIAAILGYEVAFRRNTFFIRDLDGVDLLKGNRFTNLYTINLYDMASVSSICLMAHATPTKSWLWHQRLSHLNFDTINNLAKNDLVPSLPKFKYAKEHLCPSCEQGKSKRASHPPKPVLNLKQRPHLLHMDLCGPMRVASINGKWYVLVIVEDYSGYTWVHFLRTKDETPEEYFNSVGITHETSAAKTPQQDGVGERRNRTLVKAARTMLIFSHASLFLWAEAIATACYTQNHSVIHRRFNKTPYELIQGRIPDISYLHVFGALCYPKNDREDIGKLGAKGDIGFFIGYSANSVAYRVYNRRTKKIIETMNVTFDELSAMAFEQNSSRPGLQSLTSRQISSKLELTYAPSTITP
uniref:Retrovirus-related Pol polyprotein from transposon TNT 1-94 n=1 Tax=Tanacetum cinerariifolium TaxID=118510 RepID=A0A6L2MME7_TANCI|nr:hypothetical protein [Tanacetum cinerariifolium]